MILPCGHLFGERCLKQHYVLTTRPRCPLCALDLQHPGCGHRIRPSITPAHGNRVGQVYLDPVPATRGEGGQLPQRCLRCSRDHLIAEMARLRRAAAELRDDRRWAPTAIMTIIEGGQEALDEFMRSLLWEGDEPGGSLHFVQ